MAQIPSRYVRAMHEFRAFHELLYVCMQDALPEATLSKSGAYVWRGYRINAYKTLAKGHYYLLTWHDDPDHLILEEAYNDSNGKYHRLFALRLNLRESKFFLLDKDEQKAFLEAFIAQAVQQALIWQGSDGRTTQIAPEFRNGRKVRRIPRDRPADWRQVTKDYLDAMRLQNQLFGMLTGAIRSAAREFWTYRYKIQCISKPTPAYTTGHIGGT